eukprot:1161617-Pelagomonas_calceolata.AAC.7
MIARVSRHKVRHKVSAGIRCQQLGIRCQQLGISLPARLGNSFCVSLGIIVAGHVLIGLKYQSCTKVAASTFMCKFNVDGRWASDREGGLDVGAVEAAIARISQEELHAGDAGSQASVVIGIFLWSAYSLRAGLSGRVESSEVRIILAMEAWPQKR